VNGCFEEENLEIIEGRLCGQAVLRRSLLDLIVRFSIAPL